MGDAFVMDMNQEGIGDYQRRSEITAFEPDRAIARAPAVHPVGALALYPRVSAEQMRGSIANLGNIAG